MKKPNFFIIGAPKCGTTSLAAWLAEHPQVYFSPQKEPHHFNTDHKHLLTPARNDYEFFFKNSDAQHKAVGEASVWYLYSALAVLNIEKYSPAAKYIVCIRNPVEMAYSLHEQLLVAGYESETDFDLAWMRQEARSLGRSIPFLCREPSFLQYGSVCSLGSQLERLYKIIPRNRVHTILLDDIKANSRAEYLKVLAFLGVDDDGRLEFSVKNPAKRLRIPPLRRATRLLGTVKRFFRIRQSLGLLNILDRLNMEYRPRSQLSTSTRQTLNDYFISDVELLSKLIGRDLSHWLNPIVN
jgi:hypothetical protein